MRLTDIARAICERFTRDRRARQSAGAQLAHDLDLPPDAVTDILDRTAADLRKLSSGGAGNIDARPIIDCAVHELSKLGFHSRPFEEAIMERYVQELPDRDYHILRYFKQGKKHSEIARLLGTDVDAVRRSLVSTYSELRMRLINANDGDDGGGIPAPAQARHGS